MADYAAPKQEAPKAPEFVGVISSRVSKVINAPFEGNIMKLEAHNGMTVKSGDIVAELDDTKLKHDLEQAKGQLDAAKGQAARAGAQAANASRRAKMAERMVKLGAGAPEEIRNINAEGAGYGADYAAAQGQIKSASAQIADLEGQLAKAKIASPLDGVLSVVKVREGQAAQRGMPIARVFDPQQPVIKFAVPREYAKTVHTNANVEFVSDEGGKVIPAIVRSQDDDHDPAIEFTTFEAVIDPTYRIDEIRVGDNGHVRIAGAVR